MSRMTLAEKLGELVLTTSGRLREREPRCGTALHPVPHAVRRSVGPRLRRHRRDRASGPLGGRRHVRPVGGTAVRRPHRIGGSRSGDRRQSGTQPQHRPGADERAGGRVLRRGPAPHHRAGDSRHRRSAGPWSDGGRKAPGRLHPGDQPRRPGRGSSDPGAPGDLPPSVQVGGDPGPRGHADVRLPPPRRHVPVPGPGPRAPARPVGLRRLRPVRPRCGPRRAPGDGLGHPTAEAGCDRSAHRCAGDGQVDDGHDRRRPAARPDRDVRLRRDRRTGHGDARDPRRLDGHTEFALTTAEQSAVLLKNDSAVLPLSAGTCGRSP